MALRARVWAACEGCGERRTFTFYDDGSIETMRHICEARSADPRPPAPPLIQYRRGEATLWEPADAEEAPRG